MKKVLAGGAIVIAILLGIGVLAGGDIIDLPAWANLPGVDIPLVGDTDAIDCRLAQISDTDRVEITLVDGDETTYPDYIHVWNAGQIVDPNEITRVEDHIIQSSSTPGLEEQFYSISIEPIAEGRVFCESIILD